MSPLPAVSVIMPAHNTEQFIAQAIESVRSQTFKNWELIVVDDCSTDSTRVIAESLAHEDGRIFVVHNEQNIGVAKTRNRGIDISSGEYIALLDCDDFWNPEKLSVQLSHIQKYNADIAYCSYAIVDEEGNKKACDFIVSPVATFDSTLVQSTMSCSTVLIRRASMGEVRFTDEIYHEDLALWLDLLRSGCTAVGCQEVLASYRIVAGSRASNKFKAAMHRWDLFRNYLHLPFTRCVSLFTQYGWLAVRKYRPLSGEAHHGPR